MTSATLFLGTQALAASASPLTETVLSLLDTAEATLQRSGWGSLGVRNTKCRKLEQQWRVHESKDSAATKRWHGAQQG